VGPKGKLLVTWRYNAKNKRQSKQKIAKSKVQKCHHFFVFIFLRTSTDKSNSASVEIIAVHFQQHSQNCDYLLFKSFRSSRIFGGFCLFCRQNNLWFVVVMSGQGEPQYLISTTTVIYCFQFLGGFVSFNGSKKVKNVLMALGKRLPVVLHATLSAVPGGDGLSVLLSHVQETYSKHEVALRSVDENVALVPGRIKSVEKMVIKKKEFALSESIFFIYPVYSGNHKFIYSS
jgi:hypothetical protein